MGSQMGEECLRLPTIRMPSQVEGSPGSDLVLGQGRVGAERPRAVPCEHFEVDPCGLGISCWRVQRLRPDRGWPDQAWDTGLKIVADAWRKGMPVAHGSADKIAKDTGQGQIGELVAGGLDAGSHANQHRAPSLSKGFEGPGKLFCGQGGCRRDDHLVRAEVRSRRENIGW